MVELIIHSAALAACIILVRRAPDKVQIGILALIAIAMGLHVFSDILKIYGVGIDGEALFGFEHVWQARIYAYGFGHLALLCYLVRQMWQRTGVCAVIKHGIDNTDSHHRRSGDSAITKRRVNGAN